MAYLRRGLELTLKLMQGVNVLAFYSSTLFKSTLTNCPASGSPNTNLQPNNADNTTPLWLSWGIGLENALFAIPAYWLIERGAHRLLAGKGGRRWLLLLTTPGMTLTMLAATLSYLIPANDAAHTPTVAFFTYLFMAFYSFGMGPVPFTVSSEVFTMEHRMVGMSAAVFVNFVGKIPTDRRGRPTRDTTWRIFGSHANQCPFSFLGAGLLTLFVPVIANSTFSNDGLLGVFTVLNVVAFVLIFLFVRETAGVAVNRQARAMTALSLEDLSVIFSARTWGRNGFVRHQRRMFSWAVEFAWWVVEYFWQVLTGTERRDAPEKPEDFFTWAEEQELQDLNPQNGQNGVNGSQQTNGHI